MISLYDCLTDPIPPTGFNGQRTGFVYGAGAPDGSVGANGMYYLDQDTYTLYGPKTDGTWSSSVSLVGPAGVASADQPVGTRIMIDPFNGQDTVSGSWDAYSGGVRGPDVLNAYIEYNVFLLPGEWEVRTLTHGGAASGKLTPRLDAVNGTVIDLYDAVESNVRDVQSFTISTGAEKQLRYTESGKNGSSSGYSCDIMAITLVRTA